MKKVRSTMTENRKITAKDLYAIKNVSHARISPDGKNVVYVVQRIEQDSEKKFANLWVVSTEGGEPAQFTTGNQSDTSPEWSPDGKTIAFLSNRDNTDLPAQLFMIPFGGGEAKKLTDIKGMISSFTWSPDGKSMLATVTLADEDFIERMKDEKKKKLGVVSREYDSVRYKMDGVGYLQQGRPHLWLINADNGTAEQLTDDDRYGEDSATFSPDGKIIAFVSNRAERPEFEPWKDEVYLYSLADKTTNILPSVVGGKHNLSFSPDGKVLAFYGTEGKNLWHGYTRLFSVTIDTGKVRRLTEKFDFSCESHTLTDVSPMELMPAHWSSDGKTITFQIDYHGSTLLAALPATGGDVDFLIDEGGVVGSPCFSDDEGTLSFVSAGIDRLAEVFSMNMAENDTKQLSFHNQTLLEELDLGTVEEVWFKGPDGNDLQGWITFPPDFDEGKTYPSILEIHGGPTAQYGKNFMHEFFYLAAQGYVVYYTNPRGGTGYGEDHCKAILGDWGNKDYGDLMAWVDYIEEQPYIDRDRMGVTGGSYGGFMTVWIIGHTNRFAAAVSQRCVSNLTSMWGSSDMSWATQGMVATGEETFPPFIDFDRFWRYSPVAYIGKASTPTMLIHSESDFRCPIEQSEQVFVALQYLDVPSKMVRFPDESHGLSRGGRTDRRIVRLEHIAGWFEQYLRDQMDS
jgi:dipeptidyl aminopeptidase/acylaminoacyl peptidase